MSTDVDQIGQSTTPVSKSGANDPADRREPTGRPGPTLAAWVAILIAIHAADWIAGPRAATLGRAVEVGEARVEAQASGSDLGPDAVRKLIQLQRDTRPFWLTLALLGDLAVDPLAIVLRPLLVATLLAALAALAGRPSGFSPALRDSAVIQGLWVLGPALALSLTLAGARGPADTSLALLLTAGAHSAWVWVALRQCDVFALIGWLALAVSAARRGQVAAPLALATVLPLLGLEVAARTIGAAVLGAGMRLTIVPG